MKTVTIFWLISTLMFATNVKQDDVNKQAIVKIYTTAKIPNYKSPWSSSMQSSTGSGAIIEGGYILTNAHVVANQVFIEVERYGKRKRYIAKVYAVSHQADLALLKVEDSSFFAEVIPLKFGDLPEIEQKIVVYGYPMGGSTLSATIGVVSRIEHHAYAHSGESFLAIQVDAAVNPGNSGGPALTDGKIVGVVMQVITRSQNIGYLVPSEMVKHFIDDMKDGQYDGFADLGIGSQSLENPAMRKYYGLEDNVTGKLIDKVIVGSPFDGILKEGDILTAIDGHNIEDDGTVEFRKHEYTHFHYYVDKHQFGESVDIDIIRDGKDMHLSGNLKTISDDLYLVDTTIYDKMPKYFMYGSYVFSPLSRNLISASSRNSIRVRYLASQWKDGDKDEVVVLLKVLASKMSRGDNNFAMWIIDSINGKKFKNFLEFYELMKSAKATHIVLEDNNGIKIIISQQEARDMQKNIMKRYNIEFDKSIDLRG